MRLTIQEAAAYLAQGAATNPANQGEDFGKSSPVALLLLIVFAVAVVFLIRSMTRHLKKVPKTFDEQQPGADEDGDNATSGDAKLDNAKSEERNGSGSRT